MTKKYLRFPGGKAKAITFSYDDAVTQDIRLIEIFRKYGMRGTFNVNSGLWGKQGGRHRRMTTEEALQFYKEDVCEIACHSVSHPTIALCDSVTAALEVIEDRKNLEALFNKPIRGMAYPNGSYSDEIVEILKIAGIYHARTITSTLKFDMPEDWLRLNPTCHHNNPALMELADKFLELQPKYLSQMFYVWGHSYEFDNKDNWDVIENFCEKMSHRDDIWYATNLELYQAQQDYSRLEVSADSTKYYNPNARTVWVGDVRGNIWEIKPGETITV